MAFYRQVYECLRSTVDPRRAIETVRSITLGADDFGMRWTHDVLNRPLTKKTATTRPELNAARVLVDLR